MLPFFDLEYILTGTPKSARSTRAYDKWAHVCLRALDARQDAIAQNVGGGSHEAAPRAPRRARTATRKPASGGDDDDDDDDDGDGDGDGPVKPYAISAVAHAGITVNLADGRNATLAVVDENGNVIADDVAREAWSVAVHAYRAFLTGTGHLKVHSSPPGQFVTP